MSGKGKPPKGPNSDGDKKPNKFRVVKQTDPAAKPSPEQIKQLFMASSNIEWTPFAKSMGWNPASSRADLPVADWISQKKEILAREQAEMIGEAVFNHRSNWHEDVLKTLKEYPAANDAMMGILKHRLNTIIEVINNDNQQKVIAAQSGAEYKPAFNSIKTNELTGLALAIKVVTESKHKSLLINDWSFKVAEQFTDPKQFGSAEDKVKNSEWKVEIIGGENMTNKQMGDFLAQWYDRPHMPHTREEIEAETVPAKEGE